MQYAGGAALTAWMVGAAVFAHGTDCRCESNVPAVSAHGSGPGGKLVTVPQARTRLSNIWASPTNLDWVNEKWTGDNGPYVALRRHIDAEVAESKSIAAVIAEQRAACLNHEADPVAAYGLAYAEWQQMRPHVLDGQLDSSKFVGDSLSSFWLYSSPHVEEYDRLRFILFTFSDYRSVNLEPMADRLLKVNPNDLDVLRGDVIILCRLRNPRAHLKTLNLISRMGRLEPKNLEIPLLRCIAINSVWPYTLNEKDEAAAINQWKSYMAMLPAGDEHRAECEAAIYSIVKLRAFFASHPIARQKCLDVARREP